MADSADSKRHLHRRPKKRKESAHSRRRLSPQPEVRAPASCQSRRLPSVLSPSAALLCLQRRLNSAGEEAGNRVGQKVLELRLRHGDYSGWERTQQQAADDEASTASAESSKTPSRRQSTTSQQRPPSSQVQSLQRLQPQQIHPRVIQPHVIQPQQTQPHSIQPQQTQPQSGRPQVTRPPPWKSPPSAGWYGGQSLFGLMDERPKTSVAESSSVAEAPRQHSRTQHRHSGRHLSAWVSVTIHRLSPQLRQSVTAHRIGGN